MFNHIARLLGAALLLTGSPALAHATVKTELGASQSAAGAYEVYRLNIPTEKDIPTTQVRMLIPEGLNVTRFLVQPGFVRTVRKNDAGVITEVTWKGRIAPQEFARFYFQAHNPAAPTTLVWKVYQTYQDGSVVAWDSTDAGADTPASVVTVK